MFKRLTVLPVLVLVLLAASLSVRAGNVVLSLNTGTGSSVWYISGEASMILNGFDLQSLSVPLPTRLDRISIAVQTPTPGVPVEAVVYQDENGGSPADAVLVGRKQVDITTSGVFTVTFDTPLTVAQRFLWVGFYLPVDFEFLADTSGASVLTYWAWEPGARFDVNTLSAADVIGPANGTAPVNLNMNGVARISAEIITDAQITTTPVPSSSATPAIRQIVGDQTTSLAPLVAYTNCQNLSRDQADIDVTYRGNVTFYCRVVERVLRPETPQGYTREGQLYDVYMFGESSGIEPLSHRVTHCVKPRSEHLNTAVLGLAHGAPREWEILPSVRFGDRVCAELSYVGFVSYFVPR